MINKKVLHVINISFTLPFFVGEQFDHFSNKGIKFYVACQPSEHFSRYAKEKKFVPIETNILRQISIIQDLKSIFFIMKVIKKEQIEIVIGHTPKGALIGMFAAYLAGVQKRIYFRHGLMFETSKGIKLFVLKNIERLTGFLATKVVCVSPSVMTVSENEMLNDSRKNILLNKGTCNGIDAVNKFNRARIDIEIIEKLKDQYGIKSEDQVIGYVGRLVNDKGINELLAAWKELLLQGSNIKLLLVGPLEVRDTISDSVKNYIYDTPSIICTGLIEDLAPYYCLMDVFILPSYREGFPTVVLEASAMELPVLTTLVTGCRDSIIENETGMFISLDSLNISDKIKVYLNDPVLAKVHGKNGRSFVLENFEQHEIWNEIESKILGNNL